jgi:hypothetical protein
MRILWLLNHTTAREFELPILRQLGFEVYAPKLYPYGIRSASVDFSYDCHLTISSNEIDALNEFNFHSEVWPERITAIVNSNFEMAIVSAQEILYNSVLKFFRHTILLRAYGIARRGASYGEWFSKSMSAGHKHRVYGAQDRLFFAEAYSHLHTFESVPYRSRAIFLPIGLPHGVLRRRDTYKRACSDLIIVLPDLESDAPSKMSYGDIKKHFRGIRKIILGSQFVPVDDPEVKGFLPTAEFDQYMKTSALMFYQSTVPHHLHYHPLEAMCYGMPVLCLKGGMIPTVFDQNSPAICDSYQEARKKILRIISGDDRLVGEIRSGQRKVIDQLTPEACLPIWRAAFDKIIENRRLGNLDLRSQSKIQTIGIFIDRNNLYYFPDALLREIKPLINDPNYKVVFGVERGAEDTFSELFGDLIDSAALRINQWRKMPASAVNNAMEFSGGHQRLDQGGYIAPHDGVSFFDDCDVHIYCTGELDAVVAPIKPYVLIYTGLEKIKVGVQRTAHATSARSARALLALNPAAALEVSVRLLIPRRDISVAPTPEKVPRGAHRPSAGQKSFGLWLCGTDAERDVMPFKDQIEALTLRTGTRDIRIIGASPDAIQFALFPWVTVNDATISARRSIDVADSIHFTSWSGYLPRKELISHIEHADFIAVTDPGNPYSEMLDRARCEVVIADDRWRRKFGGEQDATGELRTQTVGADGRDAPKRGAVHAVAPGRSSGEAAMSRLEMRTTALASIIKEICR